jgi:hypothetical protein
MRSANIGVALQLLCLALVTNTRSANRALHVSVTHDRYNLHRLPKDELDRERKGSMRGLLFSLPSFHKTPKGNFLRSLQMWVSEPGVTLVFVRAPAASGPTVSVAFRRWGGGRPNLWRDEEADRWAWFIRNIFSFSKEKAHFRFRLGTAGSPILRCKLRKISGFDGLYPRFADYRRMLV